MNMIKSASIYKAEIPVDVDTLTAHLSEKAFTELMQFETRKAGFVPVSDTTGLVAPFPGGFAFRVRIDEKVIPSSTVRAEVAKAVAMVEQQDERKPGRKERAEIKEAVLADIASRALVRTAASVTCFYHAASQYLIVPSTSAKITDTCTSLLVQAVGSVKTSTINVSDVKHGLTTRLTNWLRDEDSGAFGEFYPCDEAVLESEKRRLALRMTSLQMSHRALTEAIEMGFTVTSMGFTFNGLDFRLTDKFKLRSLHTAPIEGEEETTWESEAAAESERVKGVVDELVKLLSYEKPAELAQAA